MRRVFYIFLVGIFLLTACSAPMAEPIPLPTDTPMLPTSTPNPQPTPTVFTQVFPTTNPDLPLFSVHVEIVRVSNDDGSEMASVSPDDIIKQINFANEILASSSIRLIFDPQTDVDLVQSSLIASMLTPENAEWQAGMTTADKLADRYPDKITVLVRTKPVLEPTEAQGFFWWDYNIMLLSLADAQACGEPDDSILLHALGHYLGLGNTYTQAFADTTSAEKAYEDSGYNLNSFDGDGFTDTPADLFLDQQENICGNGSTITLSNTEIPVTRGNIMSGYYPRSSMTNQQIARMRYVLALRQRLKMVMPTNRGIQDPMEMENASIYLQSWLTTEVRDMTPYSGRNFSGGKALCAYAGYGSSLYLDLIIDFTGYYDLYLYAAQTPDSGTLEVYIDEDMVNDSINLYGPYTYPSGKINIGPYYLTQGTHQVIFNVIKTDPLSSGYNFCLDAMTVELRKQ